MKGLDLLQEKLEKHRECLKDVDESIKKLTGRNQTEALTTTTTASKQIYKDIYLKTISINLILSVDSSVTESSKEEKKPDENNENRIISLKRQPLSNGENNRNYR